MQQSLRAALTSLFYAMAVWGCSDPNAGSGATPSAGAAGTPASGAANGGSPASANAAGAAGLSSVAIGGAAGTASVPDTAGAANGGSGGAAGTAGMPAIGGGGGTGAADPGTFAGPSKHVGPHHVYLMEYPQHLMEISAEGKLLWEYRTPALSVMFQLLENGNLFVPVDGKPPGAIEVNRNHDIVWSFTSQATELMGGERLANGNSLLGEEGPPRVLELDQAKNVVASMLVSTSHEGAHNQIRHIHRLANGNTLAALEGEGVVREFDPTGKAVWEFGKLDSVHDALRLANGNTLIAGGTSKRVVEVTPAGQVAWEFKDTDAPQLGLDWLTSLQLLKDGNLLVGNWVEGGDGKGVHAFEVSRDKQVVWTFDDHQLAHSATTVLAVE